MERQTFQREISEVALRNLLRTESTDILTLDYLMAIAQQDQQQQLWRQLVESRKQHYVSLKSVYRYITNKEPVVNQETFVPPEGYASGLMQQLERYERRLQRLQQLLQESNDPTVMYSLQLIINRFRYEGVLLRQLEES